MRKFKKYVDADGEKTPFEVFIIHGHSKEYEKVQNHIQRKLSMNAVVLKDKFSGEGLSRKLRKTIWYNCDCAVAILSPDDKLLDGNIRARQNVIYEIGYCQGFLDYHYWNDPDDDIHPVILIQENSIEIGSDLKGVEVIRYEEGQIENSFEQLDEALENLFGSIKTYNSK